MLKDVIDVKPLPDFRLWIKFDDGVIGEADLKKLLDFKGVFAPLKDPQEFAKVYVHPECFVVSWPNGADLDSEVLYSMVTGNPIAVGNKSSTSNLSDPAHV